ncbi:pilus assembly protein TadG-related protein [Streptomyces sp. BI20]|uniref:pilus assembly protein TadG-related protein n=1 Tax=Streptomyces sp. BI20 TaxID=3403460 RepID=UPI003C7961CD
MISRRPSSEDGQAFPLYIGMLALVLFAAIAVFVVGRAALLRSDAQGAADAAALGAATRARETPLGLDFSTLTSDQWRDLASGNLIDAMSACAGARELAGDNSAELLSCTTSRMTFSVEVRTSSPVGASVVPGTSGKYSVGHATAEIDPRCSLVQGPPPTQNPEPTPAPSPSTTEAPKGEPEGGLVKFSCRGDVPEVDFDPLNPMPWDRLAGLLFEVRLTR